MNTFNTHKAFFKFVMSFEGELTIRGATAYHNEEAVAEFVNLEKER